MYNEIVCWFSIFCKDLRGLTIKVRFSKWGHQSNYRLRHSSGVIKPLTLTEYSSGLTMIGWPMLLLRFLVLADFYETCIILMEFCADKFLILWCIKNSVKGINLRRNFLEDSFIKWVSVQNIIYSAEI